MRIIEANREYIYSLMKGIYDQLTHKPKVAEVGVLKGKNAASIYEIMQPELMLLIDAWSSSQVKEYRAINSHRAWVDDPVKHEFYYGGPIDEQTTFDNIFLDVKSKFADKSDVQIIKADSQKAFEILAKKKHKKFDFIYLDASHQYEVVLDDLMNYRTLLDDKIGCFQLNDCCHSEAGARQNLGVLEAANKFCKLAKFEPVVAINRDFTDVLLAPVGSPMIQNINVMLDYNNISYVEVQNALFPNLSVRVGKRPNVSFV